MSELDKVSKGQQASLDKEVKTYIRNSEKTGNSYDKEHFDLYLQNIISRNMEKDKTRLSKNDYNVACNILYNHARVDLVPQYEDSFRTHPRAINNKPAYEVTDAWYHEAKKKLKTVRGGIRDRTKEVLRQSEATRKTPSRDQFISYMNGQLAETTRDMPEDYSDFVKAYTQGWIEKTGSDFYTQSLHDHPREVTNDFPWSKPRKNEKTAKTDNEKITLKNILNSPMSIYEKTYKSFSGHDMVCIIDIPLPNGGSINKVIGSLQTVTYSIHDEKTPVRCLGDMNAKGYVFGARTIAGTLIFSVFDKHWMHDIMEQYLANKQVTAHFLADELPPFNMTISCANEYGNEARLAIYGITLVNEGQVMSINDVYTENTYQFFAQDVDYLSDVVNKGGNTTKKNDNLPSSTEPKETKHVVYLNDVEPSTSNTGTSADAEKPSTDPSKEDVDKKRQEYEPLLQNRPPIPGASTKKEAKEISKNTKKSKDDEARRQLEDHEIDEEKYHRILEQNQKEYERQAEKIEEYYGSKEGVTT